MIKVCDLACGWTLYSDPATADPWLKHRDGRVRMPHEVARLPESWEAHQVYSALSRKLDEMDWEWRLCGNDARFIATDSAAMVMESMLKKLDRWDARLKVHGAMGVA